MPVICTFNANNLYARYRFGKKFPGDRSTKSEVENQNWGYLPTYTKGMFELFEPVQRQLSARALTNDGQAFPDIICLQEVESLLALRKFNEEYLGGRYNQAALIDSRDFRQIDVAVLSQKPILCLRTHIDDPDPNPVDTQHPFVFSRDCLEVKIALSALRNLTLFVNHFKSKLCIPDTPEERQKANDIRTHQTDKVISLVRERFPGAAFNGEWFAVVGDLNDQPGSAPVARLFTESGLQDALSRIPAETDRWTHWLRSGNKVGQLDNILLSPALAQATAETLPRIERRGISFKSVLDDGGTGPRETRFYGSEGDPKPVKLSFRFERFAEVNKTDYASDHCPVFLEIPEA